MRLPGRVLAVAAWVFAPSAFAQNAPPPSPIAVVDVQKVVHDSNAGKSIDLQYAKEHELFSDRVAKEESDLDGREQELNRQRTVLTADAFNKQRQELEAHSAEVQQTIQNESQADQNAFSDAFAQLVNTVREIVAAVAREKNATIVLSQEQVLYIGDGAVDITGTVLDHLNATLPSITVTVPHPTTEPVAGGKPPGASSPGASPPVKP